MDNSAIKAALPGYDVNKASVQNLSVASNWAFLKCDLRKQPKNYGLLNISIASIAAGSSINPVIVPIYQQTHGYNYTPGFLDSWYYPLGTWQAQPTEDQTYGTGDIDASLGSGLYIRVWTDNANFYVSAYNYSTNVISGTVAQIRFYIFADDFSGV